jgi:DNA-binding phage protein
MGNVEIRPFDPAGYIDSPEAAAAYMEDALATGNAAFIQDAMDVLARAEVARNERLTS